LDIFGVSAILGKIRLRWKVKVKATPDVARVGRGIPSLAFRQALTRLLVVVMVLIPGCVQILKSHANLLSK